MIDKLRKELNVQLEDENDFMYNIEYKGIYLINHIYESFKLFNEDVKWDVVLNTIIFDKKLRNKLYIFLGTIEEYMKTLLFAQYDVSDKDTIFNSQNQEKKLISTLYNKTVYNESNLYYVFQMTFGTLINIAKEMKLLDGDCLVVLENIRLIRNNVMHHSILLLGAANNKIDVLHEINEVKKGIESMYQVLPKRFKNRFQKSINKLSADYDIKELKLGEMKNGIFK